MKDNKNIRQLFKYLTLIIVVLAVLYLYEISIEKSLCITMIFGTIFLFYDYYAPTYIVNIVKEADVKEADKEANAKETE